MKLGALALILSVPLAFENGVIEIFQVALLILIALANLRWYRVQVYIFFALWISAMLFVLFKFLPVKRFLLKRKPLGALAIILAQAGEHYWIAHGEILEELEELVAYAMLPEICLFYRGFLS